MASRMAKTFWLGANREDTLDKVQLAQHGRGPDKTAAHFYMLDDNDREKLATERKRTMAEHRKGKNPESLWNRVLHAPTPAMEREVLQETNQQRDKSVTRSDRSAPEPTLHRLTPRPSRAWMPV
jgi:hypothetical protein